MPERKPETRSPDGEAGLARVTVPERADWPEALVGEEEAVP